MIPFRIQTLESIEHRALALKVHGWCKNTAQTSYKFLSLQIWNQVATGYTAATVHSPSNCSVFYFLLLYNHAL